MSRHIDHKLAAYIEGRLTPHDAARVYAHLQTCHMCRERLTGYEGLARKLTLSLGAYPQASRAEINRWWDHITRARMSLPRPNRIDIFAPALLIAMIVSLPLVTTLATYSPAPSRARQVVQNITASVPATDQALNIGLIPQPDPSTRGALAVSTAAPLDDTVTAAPAPLAPATDR